MADDLDRLKRLGLGHLQDQPEELDKALRAILDEAAKKDLSTQTQGDHE